MEERRKKIVDLVDAEGQITFAQLKSAFPNVSEMTLRTDLKHLNESGRIVRVHGGARSAEIVAGAEDFFSKRVQRNREQKQAIAKKAIALLQTHNWLQSIQRLLLRKRGGLSSETGCNPPVRYHRCINGFQKIWAIQHLQHLPVRCRSLCCFR